MELDHKRARVAYALAVVSNKKSKSPAQRVTPARRVPRNAKCPCGSGKKFKHCHGAPKDSKP